MAMKGWSSSLGRIFVPLLVLAACSPALKPAAQDADATQGEAGVTIPQRIDGGDPDPSGKASESCAEQDFTAMLVPVDLQFLIDTSTSMGQMVTGSSTITKLSAVRDALTAFVNDPKSAGLGTGLVFFPKAT